MGSALFQKINIPKLGAYITGLLKDTVYQAATDGFLIVLIADGTEGRFTIKAESGDVTPDNIRGYIDQTVSNALSVSACIAISKNEYYTVETSYGSVTPTVFFMPILNT